MRTSERTSDEWSGEYGEYGEYECVWYA